MPVPKGADIEWKPDGIEWWKAGGKRKKRKRKNLRVPNKSGKGAAMLPLLVHGLGRI